MQNRRSLLTLATGLPLIGQVWPLVTKLEDTEEAVEFLDLDLPLTPIQTLTIRSAKAYFWTEVNDSEVTRFAVILQHIARRRQPNNVAQLLIRSAGILSRRDQIEIGGQPFFDRLSFNRDVALTLFGKAFGKKTTLTGNFVYGYLVGKRVALIPQGASINIESPIDSFQQIVVSLLPNTVGTLR